MSRFVIPTIPDRSLSRCIARIRLGLLPSTAQNTSILDERTNDLYSSLCFWDEPSDEWVRLPDGLQQEIDAGQWFEAIAQLQVAGLITVTVEAR